MAASRKSVRGGCCAFDFTFQLLPAQASGVQLVVSCPQLEQVSVILRVKPPVQLTTGKSEELRRGESIEGPYKADEGVAEGSIYQVYKLP